MLAGFGLWLQARGVRRARTTPAAFLSPEEERQVTEEIRRFESRSSGEIVVHLCGRSRTGSIMRDAAETFTRLGLSRTRDRNAVLFFIAVRDHRFAVLGDRGIDERVRRGSGTRWSVGSSDTSARAGSATAWRPESILPARRWRSTSPRDRTTATSCPTRSPAPSAPRRR